MQAKLQSVGFDYTYDKTLYDNLTTGNIDGVKNWVTQHSLAYLQHSAHCYVSLPLLTTVSLSLSLTHTHTYHSC